MGILRVAAIFALCLVAIAHGQVDKGDGFNARLNAAIKITRSYSWTLLTKYSTSTTAPLFTRTGWNPSTGIYTAPKSGVYMIGSQVTLSGAGNGFFRLLVTINKATNLHNSMHAIKSYLTRFSMVQMHVNGFLYLNENDQIQSAVYTSLDSSLVIQPQSSFSASYMGPVYQHIGFSADKWGTLTIKKTGYTELTSWTITQYTYLWNSGTNVFNTGNGRFTAPCTGVYYVAANIRMDGANGQQMQLIAAINGNYKATTGLVSTENSPTAPYYTQNVGGAVFLTKGQYISLWAYSKSDNNFAMQSESGFHVMYMGPKSDVTPAFLASKTSVFASSGTKTLTGYSVASTVPGLYDSTSFSATTGVLTASFTGLYAVNALVTFTKTKGYAQAYISKSTNVENSAYGVRQGASGSYIMPDFTLKLGGVMLVTKGQAIRVVIRCSSTCTVSAASFSSVFLGPNTPHPGLHADIMADIPVKMPNTWVKVTGWNTDYTVASGLYSIDSSFDGTQYVAGSPGVYYVACNLRLDYATRGVTKAAIAINDVPANNNGLHAIDTDASSFVTFTMAGFVKLRAGDTVSVYSYSDDTSYRQSTSSGFSVNKMGSEFDRPSFLADLGQNITVTKVNTWTTPKPWNTTSGFGTFKSTYRFDETTGIFTAPYTGKYIVMANVRIDGAQLNAYYRVYVAVNGKTTANNGLHVIRGTQLGSPTNKVAFTETVQGVVQLKAGDKLSVSVFGTKAPYVINAESGFSACFIPGNPYGFQGDLSGTVTIPATSSGWRAVGRSFRVNDPTNHPQLWSTGLKQSNGVWTIPADGTGVYIVSANIRFDNQNGNNFRVMISINNNMRSNLNGLISMQGTPVTNYYSQQVVGTVYLRGGDNIRIMIYNTKVSASYRVQTESGFSAVMVSGAQYWRPSFLADVPNSINVRSTGWYKVGSYATHSTQFYTWGLHKFGNGTLLNGDYKVPQTGVYWVMGNLRLNAAGGRYTRLVLSVNNAPSLQGGLHAITGPPSTSYYTLHVAGAAMLTAGSKISMYAYSNSDGSYQVDTESTFSLFYLGAASQTPGFMVDMKTSTRQGLNNRYPGSWQTSAAGHDGLWAPTSGKINLANGAYTIPYAGVYLVSANIRLDGANQGYFRTFVSVNGSTSATAPALAACKSGVMHGSYHTTNIFGALQLPAGTTIQLITQSSLDSNWYYQQESGWSAAYIAPMNQVRGMSAKRLGPSTITRANQWYEVWSWGVVGAGLFSDEFFSLRTGRYTTQVGGKYYVSMNIRFDNVDSGYLYAKVLINRNLSGRARLTALMGNMVANGQPQTLSMSGVLYLPPFAQISMGIYSSTDSNYVLSGDSTYSVVYLGTSDNPECQKGGPVIAVDPYATQALVGSTLNLYCRALSSPPPVYSWYMNGQLITGQTTGTFSMIAGNSNQGSYQCAATANGRTIRSATAAVTIYGHDGTIPGFCADILTSIQVKSAARVWYTVTRWSTNSAQQTNLYDTGNFNEGTGVFTVPLSGVYIVALNMRLDSVSGDSMQGIISINNGNGINNGMSAIQGFPAQPQTININAAIYLKKRQTLRVKAYSQTDTSWGIQGESGFSARYLAPLQSVPGTMWELGADIQRGNNGWFEVTGWRAIWGQTVGTGSYNTQGRFSAPCDGIYYVASNIRVENAGGSYFRSLVAINGRTDVSNGLHHIQGAPLKGNYFTMTVVGVVQLTKGQNLSAMIYSYNDKSFTIDTASSMSIAYLSPASTAVPGFHADLKSDLSFRSVNTWETVRNWRVTGAAGLFYSSADFNENTGYFTAQTAGVYHVSALVRLDGASGKYFRIAVSIDNSPTLHNGLQSIRGSPPSSYYTMTVSGTVPLQAGQNLSIVILSNNDPNWRVQHESGFSVYLLERISPGFHGELAASAKQSSTAWVRVQNWRTNPGKSDGLFQTGTQFNAKTGYYTVSAPGVYYIASNVRFDAVTTGSMFMSLAVNDDYTRNNGLHATESFLPQTNQQFSMRVSGFIHCQIGDTVSVYVRSTTDKAYTVQSESGFSMGYIAPPLSIPAFLGDFGRAFNYKSAGFFELGGPWQVSGKNSLFISGGQAFDRTKGRFTAPADGTYWVACNVMLTGLDSAKGVLHATVGVNGQYNTTAGLHASRSAPPTSATFTLMVSGALQLNAGDYISIFVGSEVDTSWGVASQTGFSVAFVGTKLLQGFNAWGPAVPWRKTGWIRQTGFQTAGFSGLFNTFGGAPNNGLWTVPQSGWYMVAANQRITGGSAFMRTLIGISLSLSPNNGLHSAQGNPTYQSSPSVAGIVRLRAGQTLSSHFFSSKDTSYTFSTQGFSVAEISRYHPLPSFHAFRWGVNVITNGWYTITNYNTNAYTWTYDMQTGAFNNGAGRFLAIVEGVYWVSANVELSNAAGRYFRLVVAINGQNSIQGGLHSVTGPPTTNIYTMTVGGSMYMKVGDTAQLAVYSNTDLSYRINRAQFAMHFVEYGRASLGFNVDQTKDIGVSKLKWTIPQQWRIFNHNGLYINGTGLNTANGLYTAPYDGIYLVALNQRVDAANTGYFRVKVAINGSSTKEYGMTVSKTGATHGSFQTLNLINALFLYAGSKLQPMGWSSTDTSWRFQQESGWNVVYLASRSEVQAVHAKLAATQTIVGGGTKRIGGWTTMTGSNPFMSDSSFDEGSGIFTALTAGNYFISFNVRVDGISTGKVAMQFRINGGTPAVLHAYEGLPVNAPTDLSINTLSASGIVRLKRFQKLAVYFAFVDDQSFQIVDESSMSIVFMGGSDPERCPLTGVSMTQQPVGGIAAVGGSFNFSCTAVANGAIVYQWNYNNIAISKANAQWYNITKLTTANRGWYRCDATAGSDTVRGIGAYLDVYNPYPVFKPAMFNTAVFENTPKGRSILKVFAAAETSTHKAQAVTYSIIAGNDNSYAINGNTGVISRGNRNIDRERKPFYTLTVRATNKAIKTYFTNVMVNVTVLDLNDNRPVFAPRNQFVNVSESAPVSYVIATLTTTDRDIGSNTAVAYNITGGNGRGFFAVMGNQVVIANALDRDYSAMPVTIKLFFVAYNPVIPGGVSSGTVSVSIIDVNDNTPAFIKPVYNLNVSEAAKQNQWLTRVRANDKDYGSNGQVTYSIVGGNQAGKFRIDGTLGVIRLANTLDYDTVKFYTITVQARDGGVPSHSSQVKVNVQVENANDNIPLFTLPLYMGMTTENLKAGQSIVTVLATDKDGHLFNYSTSNGNFSISSSGVITTTAPLDREAGSPFVFSIYAEDDPTPPQPSHTGTAMVTVDIADVNDNTPAFTQPTYTWAVPETILVGTRVGAVTANDPDSLAFGTVTYSLATTLAPFYIQPATGIIETTAALNYQVQQSYTFTVTGTDGGGLLSTCTVTINVQNVNLFAPYFANLTYSATILENANNMTSVVTVSASDIDQPTGLTFSIVHGGNGLFTIDPTTGLISTFGSLDYETQPGYELVVSCNDNGVPPMQNITFVYIQLIDQNDNQPMFPSPNDAFGLSRLTPAFTVVYYARATDGDSGTNAQITYTLSGPHASLFNISSTNGTLTLNQPASSFGGTSISVQVNAVDGGLPTMASALTLSSNILPNAANLPQFTLDVFKLYVREDVMQGTTVGNTLAFVGDIGDSGDISYSISTNNGFAINPTTGAVYTTGTLDRETIPSYALTVTATIGPALNAVTGTSRLVITLLDANDNAPKFSNGSFLARVSEADPAGTPIFQLQATDLDSGSNAMIRYSIVTGGDGVFQIDPFLGNIYTTRKLNPKVKSLYPLTVAATNPTLNPLTSTTQLAVVVTDVNDHTPTLTHPWYNFNVPENSPIGTYIGQISATDIDSGPFGQLSYSFIRNVNTPTFMINPTNGTITLNAPINREAKALYGFQARATDGGGLFDQARVLVYITDVNDNPPVLQPSTYYVTLSQGVPQGTGVVALRATDRDIGSNGAQGFQYTLTGGNTATRFDIDIRSGVLTVLQPLNIPTTNYILNVQVSDGGTPPMSASGIVNITTHPVGQANPVFTFPSYTVAVNSPLLAATTVLTVQATGNGTINYQMATTSTPFMIDWNTGTISNKVTINSDTGINSWVFTVRGKDKNNLYGFATIHVNLIHVNEYAPVFQPPSQRTAVTENSPAGTSVITMRATDRDDGADGVVTYSVLGGTGFVIDPTSGLVSVAPMTTLDRETRSTYNLVIQASDGGVPPLTATSTLLITLNDVNDNPPIFTQTIYNATVLENRSPGAFVATVVATDADIAPNNNVSYMLSRPNALFAVDPLTGVISTLAMLDREGTTYYEITLYATDGKYQALPCHVDIYVGDANDHAPVFTAKTYSGVVSYNAIKGTEITTVHATDADIGTNAIIIYKVGESILQPYLNITAAGVVVVQETPIPAETAEWTIPILAVDSLNPQFVSTASLLLTLTNLPVIVDISGNSNSQNSAPSSLSGGVVAGIAIACILGTLLVVFLIVIVIKRGQPRHEPFEADGVKYDADSGHLAGVGISNPMYSSGAAAAIENPTYAATGGGNIQGEEGDASGNYGL